MAEEEGEQRLGVMAGAPSEEEVAKEMLVLSQVAEESRLDFALKRYFSSSNEARLMRAFSESDQRRVLTAITEAQGKAGFVFKFNSSTKDQAGQLSVRRVCSRGGQPPKSGAVTKSHGCGCKGSFRLSAGVLHVTEHNDACKEVSSVLLNAGVSSGAQFRQWRDSLESDVYNAAATHAYSLSEAVPSMKYSAVADACVLFLKENYNVDVPDELVPKFKDAMRYLVRNPREGSVKRDNQTQEMLRRLEAEPHFRYSKVRALSRSLALSHALSRSLTLSHALSRSLTLPHAPSRSLTL